MLSYADLKDKLRQLRAITSLTQEKFEKIVPQFAEAYEAMYPSGLNWKGEARQRRAGGGMKSALPQMEDKLLFIMMYHKVYGVQVAQGLQFGLSQPQANAWIQRLLPVLQRELSKLGMTPDGTDRPRQRPIDRATQDAVYSGSHLPRSGKHKTHTDKNVLLINEHTRQIVFLSPTRQHA